MRTFECTFCGYVYNTEMGDEDQEVKPNTEWVDVPESWTCPDCGSKKENFREIK